MNKIFLFIFIGIQSIPLFAGETLTVVKSSSNFSPDDLKVISYNSRRFLLLQQDGADTSLSNSSARPKSGVLAAALSAIIPGAGEYYAESYWKSAVFAVIEIAAWAAYVSYTDKGEQKDKVMRRFGNENWSSQRYWTNLYNDALAENEWTGGTVSFEGNVLSLASIEVNQNALREYEKSHTHTLPATKTQQYYEMIYKYLSQFGAGWIELGDNWDYYDNGANLNNLTADVKHYRKLRNTSNGFYEVATVWATAAMFNHVASAFDAAFTVKFYNKNLKYSIIAEPKYYAGEHVTSYGVVFTW